MSNSIPEFWFAKQQQSAVTLGGMESPSNSFGQFPDWQASLMTIAGHGSLANLALISRGLTEPVLVANTLSPSLVQIPWHAMNSITRSSGLAFAHIQSTLSSNSFF